MFAAAALAAQAHGGIQAPAEAADGATGSAVTVTFDHPASFPEQKRRQRTRQVQRRELSRAAQGLRLIKRASRLLAAAGDRLDVTITDIKLAGACEPWRGPQFRYIRYMKDIYPPRIDLDFSLTSASGKVLRSGSRKLRDIGYLQSNFTLPGDKRPPALRQGVAGPLAAPGIEGALSRPEKRLARAASKRTLPVFDAAGSQCLRFLRRRSSACSWAIASASLAWAWATSSRIGAACKRLFGLFLGLDARPLRPGRRRGPRYRPAR